LLPLCPHHTPCLDPQPLADLATVDPEREHLSLQLLGATARLGCLPVRLLARLRDSRLGLLPDLRHLRLGRSIDALDLELCLFEPFCYAQQLLLSLEEPVRALARSLAGLGRLRTLS